MIYDFGEWFLTLLKGNVEYLNVFLWNVKCIAIHKYQKPFYSSREII